MGQMTQLEVLSTVSQFEWNSWIPSHEKRKSNISMSFITVKRKSNLIPMIQCSWCHILKDWVFKVENHVYYIWKCILYILAITFTISAYIKWSATLYTVWVAYPLRTMSCLKTSTLKMYTLSSWEIILNLESW